MMKLDRTGKIAVGALVVVLLGGVIALGVTTAVNIADDNRRAACIAVGGTDCD